MMYASAESLYKVQKREELKDGTKMLLKFFSLVLGSYLFILQIPMVMMLVQGYLCEEDQDDVYVLEGVECGGLFNQVYAVISTVTLIVYVSFLMV